MLYMIKYLVCIMTDSIYSTNSTLHNITATTPVTANTQVHKIKLQQYAYNFKL